MKILSLYKLMVVLTLCTVTEALHGMRPKPVARKPVVKRTLSEAIQTLMQKESLTPAEQDKLWGYLERGGLKANRVEEYFQKNYFSKAALSDAEMAKAFDLIEEIQTTQPELAEKLSAQLLPPAIKQAPALPARPQPTIMPSQPKPAPALPARPKPTIMKPLPPISSIKTAPTAPVLTEYPASREPELNTQIAQLQTQITEQEQVIRAMNQELEQLAKIKEERDALRFEVEKLQISIQQKAEEEEQLAQEKAKEAAARIEQEVRELKIKLAREKLKTEAAQKATKTAQAAVVKEKKEVFEKVRRAKTEATQQAVTALQKVQMPPASQRQPAPQPAPFIDLQPMKPQEKTATAAGESEDPEIKEIVREHSIDRNMEGTIVVEEMAPITTSQLGRNKIPKIIKKVSKIPSTFVSVSLPNHKVNVKQVPALIQKINANDSTNYCGYYAAYNLWCFDQQNWNRLLVDRKTFIPHFSAMLERIKKLRAPGSALDELESEEILILAEKEFGIPRTSLISLYNDSERNIGPNLSSVEDIDLWNQELRTQVQSFRNHEINNLLVLFNQRAHWIAIKLARDSHLNKQKIITCYIADSLNNRNWQSDQEIETLIKPILEYILSSPLPKIGM